MNAELTCAACGQGIESSQDLYVEGTDRIHRTCIISELRQLEWRHLRYGMRHLLSRPVMLVIGREEAEKLIEPIGDDQRKPSQVFTALTTIILLCKEEPTAKALADGCLAGLRDFLRKR